MAYRVSGTSVLQDDGLYEPETSNVSKNNVVHIDDYRNPVEDFISKTSQEITKSFSADKKFNENIGKTLNSIINESEIKSSDEEINDINKVINDQVEAKKIRLEINNFVENNPKSVDNYKKEEFKRNFEQEIKQRNPNLTGDQLNKSKELANLIAENYLNHSEFDNQKEIALNDNSGILGPGATQNAWTDLQGISNFLQKKPKEIKEIKEKYNLLKNGNLKDVVLPKNLRQVGSFENIMSGLNDSGTNNLFSSTKKYLGWADKIDKWTGGWLNKTVNKAGEKIISKIGNQAISEFASNALGVIGKEGFQKGFTTVLNGVIRGGVEKIAVKGGEKVAVNASQKVAMKVAAKIATKVAVKAGAQSALLATATAFAAIPGIGWIVTAALLAVDALLWVKKKIGALAEKLGISTKRFFEENFGKVGGKIVKGLMVLVGLPALLIGSISAVILGPILIAIFGGMFVWQIFQSFSVSSLVPAMGKIAKVAIQEQIQSIPSKIFGVGCPSIWPTTGEISQGPDTFGTSERHGTKGREAIDIARTKERDSDPVIKATHEGRVLLAGSFGSKAGKTVMIEGGACDGVSTFVTIYEHMREIDVHVGQKVDTGTILGHMGDTGAPGAIHLHYQFGNSLLHWDKSTLKLDKYLPPPSFPRSCINCNIHVP